MTTHRQTQPTDPAAEGIIVVAVNILARRIREAAQLRGVLRPDPAQHGSEGGANVQLN